MIPVGRTRIEVRCVLDWNWNEEDTLELYLIILLRSKCWSLRAEGMANGGTKKLHLFDQARS